jgi:hypothetical protein
MLSFLALIPYTVNRGFQKIGWHGIIKDTQHHIGCNNIAEYKTPVTAPEAPTALYCNRLYDNIVNKIPQTKLPK